eukprot:gene17086-23505_t
MLHSNKLPDDIIRFRINSKNGHRDLRSAVHNVNDTIQTLRQLTENIKGLDYQALMLSYNQSFSFVTTSAQLKPWKVLETVDGLANKDVVMVVTSTGKDNMYNLRERIIPSLRTWMRFFSNVIIVLEDTVMLRYTFRNCKIRELIEMTSFECENEATYLLARKCNDDYYGDKGPCCKVDAAFSWIIANEELFSHVKYLLHADDDTYFRPDQVFRWLASIENSGLSHYPMIGNSDEWKANGGVWHIQGCWEIHTSGWYQPLMLNRAALQRMAVGLKSYGITQVCKEFVVTHDVAVGIFAWLHELYHIYIPGIAINPTHKGNGIFKPNEMIVHYMKHHVEDKCNEENKWPAAARYNQSVVI